VGVILLASAAFVAALILRRDYPVHHFSVVEAGVLYRSGQPSIAGWRILRDRYHVKTVIDLREDRPDEPWAITERRFCAQNRIAHVKVPTGMNVVPANPCGANARARLWRDPTLRESS